MKPLFTFITSAIILAALAIAFPDLLLDPGTLMKGHQKLTKDCLSCHTPFQGVTSVQCINCHKPDAIGIKNVAGALLPKDSSRVLFHKGLSASSCVECHTDHKGGDASKAIKTFKHASLTTVLQKDCIACHKNQIPKDPLHRYAKGSCSGCHSIKKWKPATFDHKQIAAADRKQCINCHKADQPNDQLHREVTATCAECHNTNKWEPAAFDHKQLVASGGKQCISCHKADRPNDKLHREMTASCAVCHSTKKWKPATFNHKLLAEGKQCISCHKADQPNDKMHRDVTASCAVCHKTTKWKPATFNHKLLAGGKQCISCHKADQPNDNLHRQSEANCAACHGTRKWKPATFNHNRYFRLDRDHQASCKTCHTDPGNYKKYTCYGCHEHTPSNMAAVHREEGINNYQNCIKCHRNGNSGSKRGDDD